MIRQQRNVLIISPFYRPYNKLLTIGNFSTHVINIVSFITDGTLSARKKTLKLNQLFIAPNFNELREIALDSSGQPKKLTARQLDSIKKNGEFEVSGQRNS